MNWLLVHLDTLRESLIRLLHQPVASALNVIVIGIALSLPTGFYLGLNNLQTFSRQLSSDPQVSIFMAIDANTAEVDAVEQRLKSNPDIGRVEFISRDQALARPKRNAGLSDILVNHASTPPPDALVVTDRGADPEVRETPNEPGRRATQDGDRRRDDVESFE